MELVELTAVLGNVGEFVAAIAVVATLGYVAVQIRDGRKSIDANTRSNQAQALAAWMPIDVMLVDPIIRNEHFGEYMYSVLEQGEFDITDPANARVHCYLHMSMSCGDMVFKQIELGIIDEEMLRRRLAMGARWFMETPGGRTWWHQAQGAYSAGFVKLIDSIMDTGPGPALGHSNN